VTMISVFLCDDTAELRELTRWYLEEAGDLRVVGEAGDAVTGVDQIGELEPDVVLLDLSMPGVSGLEAISMIRVAAPRTAIVILSGLSRNTHASVCIARGASDFVEKRDPLEWLRVAVRTAADKGSGAELGR
jgi:two-component system invasion response regulator UvrY